VHRYYVYMLRCFDGSFYVGVTKNVDYRFGQHCHGIDPHCYTYNRRPLKIVFVGEFEWVHDAIAFEKRLKGWSHRKKRAFAEKAWDSVKRYSRGPDRVRPR
jgi:putative endonuclease